ncbi:hypothetical protein [Sphingomonas sp. OK281]|uniref:hypothetical protein n=1 Tax=Sphingomonas sp. OK281 TaxID=1881067 RepID=UPI0008DEF60B|nr:hypothetical protein [Sphingomonas sp. OK281]SFN99261.1 hypothetical protein SAMN05428984_1480 [Sphingomonas sp. OK281]
MGAGHNEEKFKAAILLRSESKIWAEAKSEWELHLVYDDPSERACECGHQPIIQICVIRNKDNSNEAEVGNVCVHRFMKLASQRVLSVLKRVRWDLKKSLNPAALDLFARRGVISTEEKEDYLDYWRKRTNLTDEQKDQKNDINMRVIKYADEEAARLIANFAKHGLKPRL